MSVADTEVSEFSQDGYSTGAYDDAFNHNGEGEDGNGNDLPPPPQAIPLFENEPRSNFVKNYLRDHRIEPGCDTIIQVEDRYDMRIKSLEFDNLMSRFQVEPVFDGEAKMLQFLTELFVHYDDDYVFTHDITDRDTLRKIDETIASYEIVARVQDIPIPSYHTENHPVPSDEMD